MSTHATLVSETERPIKVQFRKILFATDFSLASLKALPWVTFLARRYDSTVYLAHVVSPGLHSPVPGEMLSTSMDEATKDSRRQLQWLEGLEELRGISHKSLLGEGDISGYILKAVRRHHVGLIVVGTHGRAGMKRLMLGSVAGEIFRTAPCPVLTVGVNAQAPTTVSRILFPTDLSTSSRCAVPFAGSLAEESKAELITLHVLPTAAGSNPEAGILTRPLREEAQRMLVGYLKPETGMRVMIEFGDPAETIIRQAEILHAGFIVLGVRSSFTTHGFTNVAYRVATSAPCPVLTVREAIAT